MLSGRAPHSLGRQPEGGCGAIDPSPVSTDPCGSCVSDVRSRRRPEVRAWAGSDGGRLRVVVRWGGCRGVNGWLVYRRVC